MRKLPFILAAVVMLAAAALGAVAVERAAATTEDEARLRAVEALRDDTAVAGRLLGQVQGMNVLREGQVPVFAGPGVVILCPGHRDYVKNSIASLKENMEWQQIGVPAAINKVHQNSHAVQVMRADRAVELLENEAAFLQFEGENPVVILWDEESAVAGQVVDYLQRYPDWTMVR